MIQSMATVNEFKKFVCHFSEIGNLRWQKGGGVRSDGEKNQEEVMTWLNELMMELCINGEKGLTRFSVLIIG